MQIEVNEKNEIQFYALSGGLNNGIEIDQSNVPAGFTDGMFQPGQYLYTNGTVTVNPDYTAPVLTEGPELSPKPSSEQQMINALGQQVASLIMQLSQTSTVTSGAANSTAPANDSTTSTAPASDATTTDNGGAA